MKVKSAKNETIFLCVFMPGVCVCVCMFCELSRLPFAVMQVFDLVCDRLFETITSRNEPKSEKKTYACVRACVRTFETPYPLPSFLACDRQRDTQEGRTCVQALRNKETNEEKRKRERVTR
mmetsp:Transcript_39434/g.77602  ORF Transcript_39434/g.77602 Transcript_39434/m.77602 type:complete len:121 (+) Transcript_39434:1229-1591(+)